MNAGIEAEDEALSKTLSAALASLPERTPLAVALSGGPDSTALLHALAALPAARGHGLRALHVDHRLHPDSGRWAEHCRRLCDDLDLALTVLTVTVARDSGLGLEAAARDARYHALSTALREDERLTTAHHQEDQAETFLLRALRASGPDGLAAMRPLRRLGTGWLWRPLLDTDRAVLRAYLHRHGLRWIEDPANLDPGNDRAWLRNTLLPRLRRRWPRAEASLARSAFLCAQGAELLTEQDHAVLAEVRGPEPERLALPALCGLSRARRARVLRHWLNELGFPRLPGNGVARIEADLISARTDRLAEFAWSDTIVRRWRDGLYAERRWPDLPATWTAHWDGREPLELPSGKRLWLEAASDRAPHAATATLAFEPPLRVRWRLGGETIRLPGREHRHTLKHVLQQRAIPPWRRERLPLLFADDDELLAAGDDIVSERLRDWLDARGLRLYLEP